MTSPYLPEDCIYYILKHLQNYRSTLFNCLLVTRFWCKATIPLLYANPFDNLTSKNNHSIILSLILCFNKTEILQLKNQLQLLDIHDIDIDIEYKPLFEYTKYIENYNYFTINLMIFRWLNLSILCDQSDELYKNFIPIIHQSILFQCNKIKQLDIELNSNSFTNDNFIEILPSNLSNLSSLMLNIDIMHEIELEFLNNIGNICLNLRTLGLFFICDSLSNTAKEELCTIIQKQNNLKIFKISCYEYLLNDILLSIGFQRHSLVIIEFENVEFDKTSFKNIINLCNLEYLIFSHCSGILLDHCEILKFSSFKLKKLNFHNNYWNDKVSSSMIKYLGESLQKLLIKNLTIPIIESILSYCSNLITLEITINSGMNLLIFSYFKNLKIRSLDFFFPDYYDMNEIFINLANNLSINVKEISICFDEFYNSLHIKKILENCHDFLEIINVNHFIELELLKIILNYTERNFNNLKLLRIAGLDKKLNDEELKLLNQIKAKGVKLVDICRFYYNEYSYE